MPTYDYECRFCAHRFEHFQGLNDKRLRKCPACGRMGLDRLFGTGAGLVFKGSGFYETDYKRAPAKGASKAGGADGASGKDGAGKGGSASPSADASTPSKDGSGSGGGGPGAKGAGGSTRSGSSSSGRKADKSDT